MTWTPKFKLGDVVKVKNVNYPWDHLPFVAPVIEVDELNRLYFLSNHFLYREERLELLESFDKIPTNKEIKTIYEVDATTFDTLEEARNHLIRIKLFEELSKNSTASFDEVVEYILNNKQKFVKILTES